MEEKWRRDPLSAIFLGLVIVVIGLYFVLSAMGVIAGVEWWAFMLVGIGLAFIINAIARYAMPTYRRPMFGRLVIGLILISIGGANIAHLEQLWAVPIVAVGVAILAFGIWRAMKPRP